MSEGVSSVQQAEPPQAAASAQPQNQPQKMSSPALVYIMGTVVAGIVGALIGYSFLGESLAILGIPDPGPATTFGLPFVRAAATFVATMGIGGFLMSAFGAPPAKDGYLNLDGFRAARTGTWGMGLWALLSLFLVPLYVSDVSGSPLKDTLNADGYRVGWEQIAGAKVWFWVAGFAAIAWLGSLLTRKWIWQPVFLALSLLSFVPLALEGHSASGGSHDHGVNSLLWHIICTALWVGGLAALIAHAKRRGPHLGVITRRFSYLALFCITAIAISGLINAGLRVRFSEWFTTQYGLVIFTKFALTLLLAGFGYLQSRRLLPLIEAGEDANGVGDHSSRRAFARLAAAEVLVMAGTIGVAISLSRIPPPLEINADLTAQDVLLGYTLTEPPSVLGALTMFRLDLVFGVGALLLQAGYMWAWLSLKRRGGEWPLSRVLWWTCGNVVLFVATSSGLGMYSMAMFAPHMLQHMILSMAVPVFWALGGPMTLLLRALPPAGRGGVPGPREWLVVFINNPVSRFLTNPIVAGVQFVVGFYWLYLSSAFDVIGPEHGGHLFMMLHFIISGYIFYWVIIGVDAAPRQLSPFTKMLTLFAVVVFHAWFGIAMMQMASPLNAEFYNSLQLPFEIDLMEQQHTGGSVAWALGEIPLLIVTTAHAVQWMRIDRREAARHDRKEERTGDSELEAYNAMLASMAAGQGNAADAEYYVGDYHTDEVQSALHSERRRQQARKNAREQAREQAKETERPAENSDGE